jgi:methionyl-tRNA formyltransferase
MVDKVDAGDILQQRAVALSHDDTVHSLNMKCHLAAYRAFNALLPELESGSVSRIPQDPNARTYYGRSKWASTLISWDWTVQQISRFCRALAFHPEPNPIGEAMADLNGFPMYVSAATPCAGSGHPIGTIVDVTDDYVQVAAADGDVRLHNVHSLDGTRWDLASPRLQPKYSRANHSD